MNSLTKCSFAYFQSKEYISGFNEETGKVITKNLNCLQRLLRSIFGFYSETHLKTLRPLAQRAILRPENPSLVEITALLGKAISTKPKDPNAGPKKVLREGYVNLGVYNPYGSNFTFSSCFSPVENHLSVYARDTLNEVALTVVISECNGTLELKIKSRERFRSVKKEKSSVEQSFQALLSGISDFLKHALYYTEKFDSIYMSAVDYKNFALPDFVQVIDSEKYKLGFRECIAKEFLGLISFDCLAKPSNVL